jgi:hypothetical protein
MPDLDLGVCGAELPFWEECGETEGERPRGER